MTKETEFKVGDVVVLKSGGPMMTVEKEVGDDRIGVTWFDQSQAGISSLQSAAFHRECLAPGVLGDSSAAKKTAKA